MAVASAFLRRDMSVAISYRASFLLQFLGIFIAVATFYFLSELFGSAVAPQLGAYNGQYFPFVLIGLAFSGYMGLSVSSFAQSIREGQMMGTLEALFITPTSPYTIVFSSSMFSFAYTSIELVIYLLFGVIFFALFFSGVRGVIRSPVECFVDFGPCEGAAVAALAFLRMAQTFDHCHDSLKLCLCPRFTV